MQNKQCEHEKYKKEPRAKTRMRLILRWTHICSSFDVGGLKTKRSTPPCASGSSFLPLTATSRLYSAVVFAPIEYQQKQQWDYALIRFLMHFIHLNNTHWNEGQEMWNTEDQGGMLEDTPTCLICSSDAHGDDVRVNVGSDILVLGSCVINGLFPHGTSSSCFLHTQHIKSKSENQEVE